MRGMLSSNKKRYEAQGLVEFALILPLLLLVVLGLIEAGRLIFIYAAVTSASREAVRYGSATGENAGGLARYEDCAGINAAALNIGVLTELTSDDIQIRYYNSPSDADNAWLDTCPPDKSPKSGSQIGVFVSAPYSPIIPMPFIPSFNNMTITASSRRTIIRSITIKATPPGGWVGGGGGGSGGGGNPPTPTPSITATPSKTASPTNTPRKSPTPSKTPTPSGTPTKTATPTVTYTPSITPTPSQTFTPSPTPTNTATPMSCFTSAGTISIGANYSMSITIVNNSTNPITIASLIANWPDSPSQALNYLTIDGVIVWNQVDLSPATEIGTADWIGPVASRVIPGNGGTKTIDFTFEYKINLEPVESFNFWIYFAENGCAPLAIP